MYCPQFLQHQHKIGQICRPVEGGTHIIGVRILEVRLYYIAMLFVFPVSRCDPDSQFNMSSLTKLEAAGIKVVTALQDNIEYLGNKIYHFGDSVENVTEQWEVRDTERQNPPMTWRSLLNIISQGMNMRELSQQLEDYLQHGENTITLTVYDLCLAVILIWRFGGVVPEPPIIMSANNNAETAPWPWLVAAGLNRQY